MKSMSIGPMRHDYSSFEETECALAISPCPQLDAAKDVAESTQLACAGNAPERHLPDQARRQPAFDGYDLTETLSIGWAIALTIAVALIIGASGG